MIRGVPRYCTLIVELKNIQFFLSHFLSLFLFYAFPVLTLLLKTQF